MTQLSEFVKKNYHKAEHVPIETFIARYRRLVLVAEQKFDGGRIFVFKATPPGKPPVYFIGTKHNGTYNATNFPVLTELEVALASFRDCVLDAEFIRKTMMIHCYDVLIADGKDVRAQKLLERKSILARLQDTEHVKNSPYTVVRTKEEIEAYMEHQISLGHEGAMVKANVAYSQSGNDWMKLKREPTMDVVVSNIKESDGYNETGEPWTWNIHCFDNGRQIDLGSVSSVSQQEQSIERKDIKAGTVLEVRANWVFVSNSDGVVADGHDLMDPNLKWRLRHPTVLRIRTDKAANECLLDQLRQIVHLQEAHSETESETAEE